MVSWYYDRYKIFKVKIAFILGIAYQIQVNPSKYYPTIESMYKIYLGAYNISQLNGSPAQEYSVANIKIVNLIIFFIQAWPYNQITKTIPPTFLYFSYFS